MILVMLVRVLAVAAFRDVANQGDVKHVFVFHRHALVGNNIHLGGAKETCEASQKSRPAEELAVNTPEVTAAVEREWRRDIVPRAAMASLGRRRRGCAYRS